MTSDGISDDDWCGVKEYAAEICNLTAEGEDDVAARRQLLVYLRDLEMKYGRLPSILSTMADYVEEMSESVSLNKEAYVKASDMNDVKNMSFISGELAELYVYELDNCVEGKFWVNLFESCLSNYTDTDLKRLFNDLNAKISKGNK